MTSEQVAMLTIVGSIVTTIGTITIAIYSLWSQHQQELRRAAQQRVWQEADRDLQRSWSSIDRQINLRKDFFLTHKERIADYVKDTLANAEEMYGIFANISELDRDYAFEQVAKALHNLREIHFHVTVLQDSQLTKAFDEYSSHVGRYARLMTETIEHGKAQDFVAAFNGFDEIVRRSALLIYQLEECAIDRVNSKVESKTRESSL